MSQKKVSPEETAFQTFHFRNLAGIRPACYLSVFYALGLVAAIYFLFIDQGLRAPQVRLRFYVLAGDASLYVNGKYYHNLNFSPDWQASTVVIPAGQTELRILKSGMQPWVRQLNLRASLWNNRWKPPTYFFEVRMVVAPNPEPHYLWQEAWRGYLYRGLEAQKQLSFDGSHPYPWVLSEGLRALFYSAGQISAPIPAHWSADLQRGIASITSIYQWGDLLSAASLVTQAVPQAGSENNAANGKVVPQVNFKVNLLGPRSLAILARSAVKRLERLLPQNQSLRDSRQKASKEKLPQAQKQTNFWRQYFASQKPAINKLQQPQVFESSKISERVLSQELPVKPKLALQVGSVRFMAIPGENFALQQTEVSNVQFARFWFSAAGKKWRTKQQTEIAAESFASLVLYAEDRLSNRAGGLPWGWPKYANLAGILENSLLRDQPVRGVTWAEAQAFAAWLNGEIKPNNTKWRVRLPRLDEHQRLFRSLHLLASVSVGTGASQTIRPFHFHVPQAPPNLADQEPNLFGLKGLAGSLWEWHQGDYLPYPVARSANGHSDLLYKLMIGGSWLNALPIEQGARDLWVDEFWQQDNELPVAADQTTVAGQFARMRSPYTGFRLLAQRELAE